MHEPPPDNVDEPLGLIDGLLKGLAAVTTQSIAADLRAIRAHQDCMEARTDAKLRLAELAATLRNGTRLLTPSLLTDYRTREATKQAQTLTSALLRRLSTCPPESGPATESLPKSWSAELTVGGDADKVCRQQITATILLSWSQPTAQPLPQSPAELARFGQPAYDLAKDARSPSSGRHSSWHVRMLTSPRWRKSPKQSTGRGDRPRHPISVC